jgi:nitroreductase
LSNHTDTIPTDQLIEYLRTLRQVRRFTDEPVSDQALEDVLQVARWTGSAVNRQPWEFVVVRDRETRRALAEAYPNAGHVAEAAVAIVIVMAGKRAGEAYDEGRLAERILLAARARGLGAGIAWLGNDGAAEDAKRILGIPAERFVRTAISIGYPEDELPGSGSRSGRKPLGELVHRERYGTRTED